MHNRPALDTELNQDFLRRIQNNDRDAVGELIAMIKRDIDQLSAVFKRPDFLLAEVTDLVQVINAKTIGMIGRDELKEDRASVRIYLTESLTRAIVEAISTRRNYEQLLAGLNIIISKKTGLTLIHDGILKKTAMRVLERTKNLLEKLIKSRDEHLVELIQAGKLKEVRLVIQDGGKVDWLALIHKDPDPSKGPLKTLVDLIKEDIDVLFQSLADDNIHNLIMALNQKAQNLWDEKKFAHVREDIVWFCREKILSCDAFFNFFKPTFAPKKYLTAIESLRFLNLVRWSDNLRIRSNLSSLLDNAKNMLEARLQALNDQLMKAVKNGDLPAVKDAILRGAEINQFNQKHDTPLWRAAVCGHRHIVEYLLANGVSLNKAAYAVFAAALLSRFDIVDILIRGGANLNYKSETQEPLIIKAIKLKNRDQLLSRLINAGVEIDWPLIRSKAGEDGVLLIRERLIDSLSLDLLEIVKNDNKLAFINAAQRKLDRLKALSDEPFAILYVSRDGLVESFNQFRTATPPFDPEVIFKFKQLLVDLGVSLKKLNIDEPEPMIEPELKSEPELAVDSNEVFDSGEWVTDFEKKDKAGYTPLMNAVRFGRINEAKALLNAGVKLDWRALLLKLRNDHGITKTYQRGNVYVLLKSLSLDDIDALVVSSGAKDTDCLIEKLNNQTSPMDHRGYDNDLARKEIRDKLVAAFKAKEESKSNPNLPKVLDEVLAKLLILQGKGSVNGIKQSMHELQLLHKKIIAQPQNMLSDNPLINGLISEEFRELIDATDAKAIADLIESINKKTEGSIQANVVDDLVKVVSEKREALANTKDEPSLKAAHDCLTEVAGQLSMVESSDALKQALNNLIEHLKVRMNHLADVVKVPSGRPHTVFRELTQKEKKAREERPYAGLQDLRNIHVFDDTSHFSL